MRSLITYQSDKAEKWLSSLHAYEKMDKLNREDLYDASWLKEVLLKYRWPLEPDLIFCSIPYKADMNARTKWSIGLK